ncbi:MAG: beta-ketoacyl synthase N-terminal-like domain-containing protein [Thermomicrobiales bacterium]
MLASSSSSLTCPVCQSVALPGSRYCSQCGAHLSGEPSTRRRRVVVTGVGAVTSVGMSAPESWRVIMNGGGGIVHIPELAELGLPCTVRGAVDHSKVVNHFLDPKTARNTSPFSLWMLEAAGEALLDAGLLDADLQPLRDLSLGGAMIGTCVGAWLRRHSARLRERSRPVVPIASHHLHVKFPLNMAGYTVQWRLVCPGPSNTVSTACATGTQAIGEAYHVIADGLAPIMVAGATEVHQQPTGDGWIRSDACAGDRLQ